ncbi:MAG TPA: GspMb/PilO family protein, partial [Candidatus Saccharicenans sp.]|nr:GspMb/PilO family protein [Candidatus Saccharicenans sp.]
LQSWQLTQADLAEIKENSFYAGQAGIEVFRQDLSQVFQKSGLPLPPISYQYEEDQKKEFRRLSASFGVSLSYPRLKRFLYELEAWPRIWLLDQINFQKIDNVSGMVDLRLTVAGFYYEEK